MTFKRIRAQTLCIIAANAVSIILSVSLFISAALLSESQKTQFSAENWTAKNSKFAYSQQSAFIGNDAEFTTDSLDMVREIISNEITNASIKNEENNRLWYDSYYSRIGKFQAHGTVLGNTECEINAVNGDFFMLHYFRLINGAFFSDNDLMQDYAVIDDNTAWKLFGSSDVVGMSFTVNNNDFYVSGVIERPKSKGEIEYYGKSPEIYISYDSASAIIGEEYSAISCYEAVLPEPVENLFKLIRIRLLATNIHITQIQETSSNIRLYTPFTVKEWNIIRYKLPLNITKYFNWTKPQKQDDKLKGVILMKNEYLDFNETFNILADLFYHISKIVLEFRNN